MEDENGLDSKVVDLARPDEDGQRPASDSRAADEKRIGDYFARYRQHEPGKFSRVPGWGSVSEGRAHVDITHAFFRQCQKGTGRCVVK